MASRSPADDSPEFTRAEGTSPAETAQERQDAIAARENEFLRPFSDLLKQVRGYAQHFREALFPVMSGRGDGWTVLSGRRSVNLLSNDYLGLGRDARVMEAAGAAILRLGTSRCASPVAGGYTDLNQGLEERLAEFVGKAEAVVLASGYQANLSAISGVMERGDLVVCDLLSHASIVDGVRLAGAELRFFQHNNTQHLDAILGTVGAGRRVMVAVEGVYSADGDTVPLADVCRIAHRHGALVLLDEAHSLGVFGSNGAGLARDRGMTDEIDLFVGTMSKSIGMIGGFIAGSRNIVDVIRHRGRSLIFSAALPPAMAGGALRSLEIIETEPERRERLWENCRQLMSGLQDRGFDTLRSTTPVIPLLVSNPEGTVAFTAALARAGVGVCPAIPPMVQPHLSRIRMHVSAVHEKADIDHALDTISHMSRKFDIPRQEGVSRHEG